MSLRGDAISSLAPLLENNRAWSARCAAEDPQYFERLAHQQTPRYLWIGCSDNRESANEILGLRPVGRSVSGVQDRQKQYAQSLAALGAL